MAAALVGVATGSCRGEAFVQVAHAKSVWVSVSPLTFASGVQINGFHKVVTLDVVVDCWGVTSTSRFPIWINTTWHYTNTHPQPKATHTFCPVPFVKFNANGSGSTTTFPTKKASKAPQQRS